MKLKLTGLTLAAAMVMASAIAAQAQTALKWAHVYETSEPFHTESVWAAEEIGKRTEGRYKIDVFPASQLGKEAIANGEMSASVACCAYLRLANRPRRSD